MPLSNALKAIFIFCRQGSFFIHLKATIKNLRAFYAVSFLLAAFFLSYYVKPLAAFETFDSSAGQLRSKEVILSVYVSGGDKDVLLSANNLNAITINGLTYTSASESRFDSRLNSGYINARLVFNPADSLYYWLRVKTGQSDFKIPTLGAEDNVLSDGSSWGVGFGARKQVLPFTIVTPLAFALDGGVDFTTSRYYRFKSKSIIWATNSRLNNIELQIAALLSFRRNKGQKVRYLEPTVGLKISKVYSTLMDYNTFERVEGVKDDIGFVTGLKVNLRGGQKTESIDSGESLNIEADWGFERKLSCGLSITLF